MRRRPKYEPRDTEELPQSDVGQVVHTSGFCMPLPGRSQLDRMRPAARRTRAAQTQPLIAGVLECMLQVYGLAPERIWVSVYQDDEEAYGIWRDSVGVPDSRIQRLGAADNFWESGATGAEVLLLLLLLLLPVSPPLPLQCCLGSQVLWGQPLQHAGRYQQGVHHTICLWQQQVQQRPGAERMEMWLLASAADGEVLTLLQGPAARARSCTTTLRLMRRRRVPV